MLRNGPRVEENFSFLLHPSATQCRYNKSIAYNANNRWQFHEGDPSWKTIDRDSALCELTSRPWPWYFLLR